MSPATATGKAKFLWTLDMIKELKVYPGGLAGSLSICSPLVVDDLVFIVTGNGVNTEGEVPAPNAPSFIAVDKKTGKVVWKDNSPGKKIMDGQWSNPAAAKVNGQWQVIFPGGDGWLYSFEAKTGKLIWKFDCNPKKSDFQAGRTRATRILHRHARSSGRTSSTSASARTPRTATAWAICGASTSPRRRRTRTKTCRRSTTISIPRPRSTRTPVWSGTSAVRHAQAGGRQPRIRLRPQRQHRGHP